MSITLFLILITVGISVLAFNNGDIKYKLIFSPTIIESRGEWYRFLTCGFIHADFIHLLVNMYVLYMFGEQVEAAFHWHFLFPGVQYVFMYLLTIILANVRTFYKERHNDFYFSLGASGGVSGIVFSFMVFFPMAKISLLFIPIGIPAFVMGPLYLVYSHYMSRRANDHINHDAHLWGAIVGILYTVIQKPDLITGYFR